MAEYTVVLLDETNSQAKAMTDPGAEGDVLKSTGSGPAAKPVWLTPPWVTDPMTTRGDIIVRNASNVIDRLAVGAGGTVLKGGLDPNWGAVGTADFDTDVGAMFGIIDSMAFNKPDLTIVDASGLKFEMEALGGGDMYFQIDGVKSTVDCTTGGGTSGKARVALTAGADENNPTTNYLYITDSGGTGTLAASTSLPTGAFAWVGKVVVPDATTWATTGAYVFQRYTEAFQNDTRGALSHEREKLRALGAVYIGGVSQTLNITPQGGGPDNVHLATTSGSVYQLHRQTFPLFSTGPYYYGNGTSPYTEITDLNAALAEVDGTSLSGRRFNLVIWGAVNITTGECKLFVNLPEGSYSKDADAMADTNNSAIYSVPDDMYSVGFLIARLALRHTTASSGTWQELGVYSLLRVPAGSVATGSGVVAATEYVDSLFRIYDNVDPTKVIAFEASSITTGTLRTMTIPDRNGTIVVSGDVFTGDVTGTLNSSGSTALAIAADAVKDTHIDWGTGAGQVSAADMPIADGGGIITATEVEAALQENRTAINLNTTHRSSDGSDHTFIDQDVTITGAPTFANATFSTYLQITPTASQAHSEGLLYYNSDDKTFVAYNDEADIGMNIGEEMWKRVRNNSGSLIADGTPVYISGAVGQLPTIVPTDADSLTTSKLAGVATHDIENNSNGYITVFGVVRGLDTDGSPYGESWSDGDEIFISNTAGELTNVRPTTGYVTMVGIVDYAHTSEGKIEIQSHRDWTETFKSGEIAVDNILLDGNDISSISGNLTLTPVAGSAVVIDGGASFDGSVLTGLTALTSTAITGTLQTASQTNITGLGTIVTGVWEATDVAVAHGGTGASTAAGARTNLDVDQAGTDNSTDVTLAGSRDYITIVGQVITRNEIDISDDTNLVAGTNIALAGDTLNVALTTGTNVTGDHGTASIDEIVNVCYGTSATPPSASGTTEGALYIQYEA